MCHCGNAGCNWCRVSMCITLLNIDTHQTHVARIGMCCCAHWYTRHVLHTWGYAVRCLFNLHDVWVRQDTCHILLGEYCLFMCHAFPMQCFCSHAYVQWYTWIGCIIKLLDRTFDFNSLSSYLLMGLGLDFLRVMPICGQSFDNSILIADINNLLLLHLLPFSFLPFFCELLGGG